MTSPTTSVPLVLPAPGEALRLLAVHAHPDDESSKGAASAAKYVREGVSVLVVTATGGERGDVLNAALAEQLSHLEDLTEYRREEMARAAQILGVDHAWLGFIDSGYAEGDPLPPPPEGSFAALPLDEVTEPLVAIVRAFRPHVMTTYDENGGYPHADHIRTHEISMRAFELAGDPRAYPDSGAPWQPLKLYYHANFSKARIVAMHEAALAAGLASRFGPWLDEWVDKPEDVARLTTRIECSDYFTHRHDALKAHATQVDPDGDWFSLPLELEVQVWPTEDYQLARSVVEPVIESDGYERDLFSGLRTTVQA